MREAIYQAIISDAIEKGGFTITFEIGKERKSWCFSKKKVGNGIKMYIAFLNFMGVKATEELLNKYVRCYMKSGKIIAVGLIEEDKFFMRNCIDGVSVKQKDVY